MQKRLLTANVFAFIVLGLFLGASTLIAFMIVLFPGFEMNQAVQTLFIYIVSMGVPALVYGFYVRKKAGQPFSYTFSFRKIPGKTLLICVALGFLMQPLMSFIAVLASLVFTDITTSSIEQLAEMPLPFFILTTGILPAFFEELVCRGMMLDGYRETPLWYMLLIPALFFGFLHMNFQQISYAVAAGVMLAYLVKVTGSIWSSMIVHFIINGTQSFLLWLSVKTTLMDSLGIVGDVLSEEMTPAQTFLSASIMAAVALPLFLLCLYGLRKIHGFEEKKRAMSLVRPGWHEGSTLMYVILGLMFVMAVIVEFLMPLFSEFL